MRGHHRRQVPRALRTGFMPAHTGVTSTMSATAYSAHMSLNDSLAVCMCTAGGRLATRLYLRREALGAPVRTKIT